MIYFFELFIAAVLIALNAAFVLAEFALVKVRLTRIEELAAAGNAAAKLAKRQVERIDAYLSSIQLGITMASLGLGWVGEPALAALMEPVFQAAGLPLSARALHTVSFAIAFVFITGFHVVVGEQAPKYLAIQMPERYTLLCAWPLEFFYKATYFPMLAINKSANFVLSVLKIKASESEGLHSDEELRMILGQSQEHGRISLGRLMMFEHLFDFGKTRVKEIMTPRAAITALDPDASWAENLKPIKEKQFSRYPLLGADGKFTGYVHLKDLAYSARPAGATCAPEADLKAARRPLAEISEEMTAEKALRDFQERRLQIALAHNAKGEITGLLSMEDIIEELTGEIRDEFEQPPKLLLSTMLAPEACVLDLKSHARFDAIGELLDRLHAASPVFDKDEALKAIVKRENNFSTALGHQSAFPHARLASLSKPLLAIGKSSGGIDFPAPDNQPVKVLFMILTPFNEPTLQLNILAQLSGLISNLTLRKRLFSAETAEDLLTIILTFQNKVLEETARRV